MSGTVALKGGRIVNMHRVTYAVGLAPDQERVLLAARNLAEYLRQLDAAGFARLLGACQAEATERGWPGAVIPLGQAQSACETYRDDAAPIGVDATSMIATCADRQRGDGGYVAWQRAAELPDTPYVFPRPSDTGLEGFVPLPAVEDTP